MKSRKKKNISLYRNRKKVNQHNNRKLNPKPKKKRKIKISLLKFRKALKNSHGNISIIAERLGVAWTTVDNFLKRSEPSSQKARKLFKKEKNRIKDVRINDAITRIHEIIKNGNDKNAGSNARWLLEKLKKEDYGKEVSTTIKGDKNNPININQKQVNIPIEALDLPLELQKQLLEAIEKKEDENI